MRIGVFHENYQRPTRYVSKATAIEMIRKGTAVRTSKNAVRVVRHLRYHPLQSKQGAVYESAGSERFPRMFNGGLTRTEHCPKKIKPFQGARVGH